MLTTKHVSSMYAQIVNGVPKEKSQHVTDEESAAMWDTIAGEVEEMRAADPNIVFSVPNEMPDADDDEPADGEEPEEPADDVEPADGETDPPADEETEPPADEETEPPTGGKPKKGVNPFPKKDES